MDTTTRNADLKDLYQLLQDQHVRKLDVVAPAAALTATNGNLVIAGVEARLDESGVTTVDGTYRPNGIAVEGIAEKLGVPLAYLRKIHAGRPDLFDANVNGWLHGGPVAPTRPDGLGQREEYPADGRSFLVRSFRGDNEGDTGIARAFLSDSYGIVDNLDLLVATLEAIRDSGVEVQVGKCDLTDRKMYVKVHAPAVAAAAPALLAGYQSPFSGNKGADNPLVFAGFVIQNSETGDGAMSLVPRITVQVCTNGMTITKDALRRVHVGRKMDAGEIRWSDETQRRNLELVKSQVSDAVRTFLDVDYLTRKIDEATEAAGVKINGNPEPVVQNVGKRLNYTERQMDDVMEMFIKGADVTSGGVMHAVTAAAQVQADADTAATMEADAFDALHFAAALARQS